MELKNRGDDDQQRQSQKISLGGLRMLEDENYMSQGGQSY